MKTANPRYFNTCTILFEFLVLIILGFSVSGCVRSQTKSEFRANGGKLLSAEAVNINTASLAELEKVPYIGEGLARRIVEHRENHGRFRRAEHLLLIEGIGDRRFRQIRDRIKVE